MVSSAEAINQPQSHRFQINRALIICSNVRKVFILGSFYDAFYDSWCKTAHYKILPHNYRDNIWSLIVWDKSFVTLISFNEIYLQKPSLEPNNKPPYINFSPFTNEASRKQKELSRRKTFPDHWSVSNASVSEFQRLTKIWTAEGSKVALAVKMFHVLSKKQLI